MKQSDIITPRVANMTPFNGSRIGILTVLRQRIEMTPDELFLQRALLAKPKQRPFDRSDAIVMAGGVAVIAFLIFARWKGWL